VQRLRRLIGRRTARADARSFVVEGATLLEEALAAGAPIEAVYLDPWAAGEVETGVAARCLDAGGRVFELEDGVMARVAGTVSPQPIVAIVAKTDIGLGALGERHPTLVVVCVDVRDPGNAGTVLRSAEASGADGVVFAGEVVDVFNPKTVRASAGALFHVPVVSIAQGPSGPVGGSLKPADVLDEIGRWGLRRHGTVAHGGTDYSVADLSGPVALVVGNEANGLPEDLVNHLDEYLTIPMVGRTESINVSMAAAVLCFEVARQRRMAPA
ncbi:MAG: RNA methyltransferase, partial [Actinomycetota bacterium]|nr:RNA methyltransferase [Actinomycetota bacterium]